MNIFLFLLTLVFLIILYKRIKTKNSKNLKINKFKKKFLSKESNIEKIFLRDEEKTSSNPNIDIRIGLYESEDKINRKSNIHRARLSKFRKSKLNGEMIYLDSEKNFFKFVNGKKIYL